MFFGKKILVGVTGGIAAYKAAFLVRELKKSADVRVVMTKAAGHFVSPLTFEALSGHKVAIDLFGEGYDAATAHIDWARWPDLILVCPATANTIGKAAHGLADNMLTTIILAATAPVIFCPAMNVEMYKNAAYQHNEKTLLQRGCHIVQPGEGELACGEIGIGRLAETEEILAMINFVLNGSAALQGKRVLVTAGPTHEALDPVRYLANRSSGKMGYALAEQAALRGAAVTLISGPTGLPRPYRTELCRVVTAQEMHVAVQELLPENDVLIMAAAVADFRPAVRATQKIKKESAHSLELTATVDILQDVAKDKGDRLVIGFALETEDEMEHAAEKLYRKKCDLLVVNNPSQAGAGFEVDTNIVTILRKDGSQKQLPLMSKTAVAQAILDELQLLLS
ncbi:bifunctional phosphopantothenoylcysteine decarboxylase/phosphopantothenate--cysteine ligase CoaBC [candidate division KSB1 bacterium]|nr:bifunctional phosphopantothenoylcysteine decarboxylase/phosphopantothenate--cysteine ligase CoaBC [candidate division KSB1 bacterium]RQW01400.1 MAG: bifunctional phosphopantothenoylcysteine decarboxylase/phosphopantothenate--cysteine ligase CoaBC [candidate division KSB1 bacterium]